MDDLSPDRPGSDIIRLAVCDRSFRALGRVAGLDCSTFWDLFAKGEWEPRTLAMIDAVTGPGTTFYDVGSWIGPTALWAATRGGRVFAFEPDPIALQALRANVSSNGELSGNIEIVPAAVGDRDGSLTLYNAAFGNSETSVFAAVGRSDTIRPMTAAATVPMIDLVAFVKQVGQTGERSFIKMDIEGAEFDLMPKIFPLVGERDIPLCVTLHPFNIVDASPTRALIRRVNAIACALEPYSDLNWSAFDGKGFSTLDRESIFLKILNNPKRNATIIFSKDMLPCHIC